MDAQTGRQPDTAILVLGMHRSGTSAVTRCLNLLGAALPKRLMISQPSNPLGHFEPQEIANIHDRLLATVNSSWDDWSAFPSEWQRSPHGRAFLDELCEGVAEDYPDRTLVVVKDPRLLRFVPVWREVLARLDLRPVAVLPYRNPVEVALSLKVRDGFPMAHGLLLWLRHVLDAEQQSRDIPRAFVSYETLLEQTPATIDRLAEALPIDWPRPRDEALEEIGRFLDTKLRRNTAPRTELSLDARVPEEIRAAYEFYERLTENPADPEAMARLDGLRDSFPRVTSSLMPGTFRHLQDRFDHDGRRIDALADGAAHHRRQAEAAELAAVDASAALSARIEALTERLAQQERRAESAEQNAVDTNAALSERLAQQERRAESAEQAAAEASARLDAVEATHAELQSEIRALERRIEAGLAESGASGDRHEGALAALESDLAAARGRLQTQSETLRTLQDSFVRVAGEVQHARSLREDAPLTRRWRATARRSRKPDAELVLRSGLFDPDWYREAYGLDAATDPLEHFVTTGSREGLSPGPLFDARFYQESNPDVVENGLEPLVHYIRHGRKEGRAPVRPS